MKYKMVFHLNIRQHPDHQEVTIKCNQTCGRALHEGIQVLTFIWNTPPNVLPFPECPSRKQKHSLEFTPYPSQCVAYPHYLQYHLREFVCPNFCYM